MSWPIQRRAIVCWQPGVIQRYESIWSIMHKFARRNIALPKDLWALFSKPCPGAATLLSITSMRANLSDPRWIDRSKLEETLGLDADQIRSAFGPRYALGRQDGFAGGWGRPHLRFCEQCLTAGYHSPVHFLPFVTRCPIHDRPLQNECPKCERQIPHSIPNQTSFPAYACQCGHPFWVSGKPASIPSEGMLRMNEIVAWIDLVNSKTPRLAAHVPAAIEETWELERTAIEYVRELAAFDPMLAPPSCLCIQSAKHRTLSCYSGGAGDHETSEATALGIYKAIRRRLSRRIEARRRSNRFSHQEWLAVQSEPARIALHGWRSYWEGYNALRSNPSVWASGKWQTNFLTRYRQLFRKEFRPDPGLPSDGAAWAEQRVVVAACLGTFAESLRRSATYTTVDESSRLGDEITGELVPVCITGRDMKGEQALHFWTGPEFVKVRELLNETNRAA